ncbi:MAG: hypothetical protein JO060_05610 [Candidatus Eremiobacteraeota bacterium]|nr:hypothetical protein [Candidatus Eremiobacteraeota bacterium]
MSEDDLRDLLTLSDLEGPLVDWRQKGNTVEYLGHEAVDGDDALHLKITMKDGDVIEDYLDPDTYMEIRRDVREYIRGQVRESVIDFTAYKAVNGVFFPYSIASGPKDRFSDWQHTTIERIVANAPLAPSDFALPPSLK